MEYLLLIYWVIRSLKNNIWLVLNLYTLYPEISHLKDLEGIKKTLTNPKKEATRNIIDKVDNILY